MDQGTLLWLFCIFKGPRTSDFEGENFWLRWRICDNQ